MMRSGNLAITLLVKLGSSSIFSILLLLLHNTKSQKVTGHNLKFGSIIDQYTIETIKYYMVKKEKMKKLLEINPLSFYVTNWGFVNNTQPKRTRKTNQPSPKN